MNIIRCFFVLFLGGDEVKPYPFKLGVYFRTLLKKKVVQNAGGNGGTWKSSPTHTRPVDAVTTSPSLVTHTQPDHAAVFELNSAHAPAGPWSRNPRPALYTSTAYKQSPTHLSPSPDPPT